MHKRILSLFLTLVLLLSMLPQSVFAAHDSTGRPLDLTGDVYLALYIGGSEFPGEPAEYAVSGYLNLNNQFTSPGFVKYAESAEGIIKESILDDVVQGTSGVWGVFSTTGGSRYLDPANGIVNADGTHNAETEAKIIQTAIDNNKFSLGAGESIDDYTIIWYVIKYQRSDSAWHIDGLITKKSTYSVNYYGNGNTAGAAPTGTNDIEPGSEYTVLGNTGGLRKIVGRDTYIFNGWNTKTDGTGEHYDAGDVITVNDNVTLYAEWYLQNKYTVTFVTKLDDVETNLIDFHEGGEEVTVWARLEDENGPVGEFFQLEKGAAGTYTAQVTENGSYYIYHREPDGTMHQAHGHQIVIYNQNGRSECLHYSVTYDANAGSDSVAWSTGAAPAQTNYHAGTAVVDGSNIPSRLGYTFLYWKDQNGNIIYPGDTITESISEKTVLTAQWQENIDVTVNVTIDHNAVTGGRDTDTQTMFNVIFQLLREENGVDLPLTETYLNQYHFSYTHDHTTEITTYSVTFTNMPQGIYKASAVKSHYTTEMSRTGEADEDQVIDLKLTYTPQNKDLTFDVIVNFDNETEKKLLPTAVNVRILAWAYDDNGVLGWHLIAEHMDGTSPITVAIDPETGKGTGFFPVYLNWPTNEPYQYRVIVSSFVMPDGRIIPASGDLVTYKPNGSGLYNAVISIEPDGSGRIPDYPAGSDTELEGAYFEDAVQVGIPTVTIDITPYKVTFVGGEGTVGGKDVLVLENQYLYPDLRNYIAVPNDANDYFTGWFDENGNPVTNLYGDYLTGDVTYYARYSLPMQVQGNVTVDGTYVQDGETININRIDLPEEVMVVLQKQINGNWVDMGSRIAPITFGETLGTDGTGSYLFENLPNDGSIYRVKVLILNFASHYDNESDPEISYSEEEYVAILGDDTTAQVDILLELVPELYEQMMEVDASQIAPSFRPDEALSEILYRDLGDIHHFNVIAQHTLSPYGTPVPLAANGLGSGSFDIWKNHTDGSLYEYQMNITKLYGNVDGVFTPEGTPYNSDTSPFTIEYGPSSRFSAVAGGQARVLKATLVPKEYEIIFDLGGVTDVQGMDQYLTDGNFNEDYYSYLHTWSYGDEVMAFPYREGYVFEGWESNHEGVMVTKGGYITVAAGLSEDVTLTAKWRKLEGKAYTVRHLELNTDLPLHGAVAVENTADSVVKAVDMVLDIEGYNYVAAMVDGKVYSLNDEPEMKISDDPAKNVLTIYYLPDGSDGYTDQVESNLKLDKSAVLENNGTYTIYLETYTMDNPITTLILQNTPLDIVMVIDQSGSIVQSGYLDELQAAVDNFVELIADHGRHNKVDHRIAIVGYAGDYDEPPTSTNTNQYPIAGGNTTNWVNTGVFDSNGDFHPYSVTGFNYTPYSGTVSADGVYYTYSDGEYLLLSYHEEYRHLITEEQARLEVLGGTRVYGYVYDENGIGSFVELTRNSSGLWLYGDKQLYSDKEFFTYHEDVWTHRRDLDAREIHAYGTGANYKPADGHDNLYTRTETTAANPQLNVYYDALVPVSVGANGSGGTNPNLLASTQHLGSNGGTYVQYGIEMANKVFEANPLPADSDRVRIMVMFTDGLPGIGTFDKTVANEAIEQAYIAKNTHGAYSYTIGLYPSNGVNATDDESIYMNAVSSNYPEAQSMDDVIQPAGYIVAEDGARLDDGDTYYYKYGNSYYEIKYGRVRVSGSWSQQYCWYYTRGWSNYLISTATSPAVSGGKIGNNTIYTYRSAGYQPTDYSGYYSTTDSEQDLKDYFAHVMQEITTKITREIILHEDTILRDIMGQGLVLTPGTVITAYKVAGTYTADGIIWAPNREQVAQLTVPGQANGSLFSPETTSIQYYLDDGSVITKENVPYISVYNLGADNATDPSAPNYHPHTVDITGYDFENWYISEEHTEGYKMVVEITRVEARDDVEWGRSTATNMEQSGLWLPADENGNRELLLPFEQPTTIFVERAYVLDYGKEFVLGGWYFDSEDGKIAIPIHLDCDISDGMNWFDPADPNLSNGIGSTYGNTKYGNVRIEGGKVIYTPTSMNWHGYDEFYVFGNTWRKTVLAQDANQNGNLWNKVTVIPANNIYYEDSFLTTEDSTVNGFEGFTFSDGWTDILGGNAGENTEIPEHLENAPFGDVHGWTDSLGDDIEFTDGNAHFTDKMGASAQFTFTGTGVDVYTRTNAQSGMVVAVLTQHNVKEDGTVELVEIKSIGIDNLAVSGDYYHIPTVSFDKLVYGTYTLQLIATEAITEEGSRYEYYIDGVRVYNPLGSTTNYAADIVKDAYGLELNAVFTEVRDILLDYGDFNIDMPDDEVKGAVFIDQIKPGQESGSDQAGVGVPTYEIGTFQLYGPKNEVYLSAGQAIVLKVDPKNTYYVGLKSLTGGAVDAHVSGITQADPTTIHITHTTDMFYRVTPVDGYIVIQNGNTDGQLLSITNLRTTNPENPAAGGGVQSIMQAEAVLVMRRFARHLAAPQEKPEAPVVQEDPVLVLTAQLFSAVRDWLETL